MTGPMTSHILSWIKPR